MHKKAERWPLTYLVPDRGLDGAWGIDLAASDKRRIALTDARDSGKLAATAPIGLVDLKGKADDPQALARNVN